MGTVEHFWYLSAASQFPPCPAILCLTQVVSGQPWKWLSFEKGSLHCFYLLSQCTQLFSANALWSLGSVFNMRSALSTNTFVWLGFFLCLYTSLLLSMGALPLCVQLEGQSSHSGPGAKPTEQRRSPDFCLFSCHSEYWLLQKKKIKLGCVITAGGGKEVTACSDFQKLFLLMC